MDADSIVYPPGSIRVFHFSDQLYNALNADILESVTTGVARAGVDSAMDIVMLTPDGIGVMFVCPR
ncbi:hypothetical protein N7535_001637 [Penicillium sp. DV-2018c]|nr:hypothetical protein N7535_001637 [Penicillium sp. DV-2018c]